MGEIIRILKFNPGQVEGILRLWERVPMDGACNLNRDKFRKTLSHSERFDFQGARVAMDGENIVGFGLGVKSEEKTGYLSILFVDPDHQGKGIGSKLLDSLEQSLKRQGVEEICTGFASNHPLNFAPGINLASSAYTFFLSRGFRNYHPTAHMGLYMWLELKSFYLDKNIHRFITENEERGIKFGLCEKDYRQPLLEFMNATFPEDWTESVKSTLEGEAPYLVVVATCGEKVVGFAGPISVTEEGRGVFTGIGTHPEYRRRKIGKILFNLLCQEFKKRGADYIPLRTALNNPAQELYFSAGFKVKSVFDYYLIKHISKLS